MYGPPGTGKTLLARACAAQTDATFLKLAGPQLVQMFIGDGAKLVRDCFALAKEKAPSIIFIDELDAIGTKRFDSEKSGDREVQRTMLELLNQLDGFASDDRIKVLAATNRVDVLDPALLRSGRLDRKIEFPLPNEEARAQIMRIHSRKMTVDDGVNWAELARSTDEFGGAMLKAVCVEAGMIALRNGQRKIIHEHYVDAIAEVQAKKKDVSISESTSVAILQILICVPDRQLLCLSAISTTGPCCLINRTARVTVNGRRLRSSSDTAAIQRIIGRARPRLDFIMTQ
jgi:26S proteasome regulatory subunit T5